MGRKPGVNAGADHPHKADRRRFLSRYALSVIAGEGMATVGGETIPIGSDMSIVVPPCTPHGYRNTGAGPLRLVITLADADARLGEPVDTRPEIAKP